MPGDEPVAVEALRLAPPPPADRSASSSCRWPPRVDIPLGRRPTSPPSWSDVAHDQRIRIELAATQVLDLTSANDPHAARALTDADLIVIPGGDPDLLPTLLPGTAAWQAILGARRRGAVIWGASAGAMALAAWC